MSNAPPPAPLASAADQPVTAGRRWAILGLLAAICFLCHFNRVSMSVAGNERLMKQYGIGEVQMGAVYSAYLLAYTLCMIPGGWLIDRFGAWRMLLIMGFGSAAFVGLTGAVGLFATAGTAVLMFCSVRAMLGIVTVPMHPGAARAISQWIGPGRRAAANGLVTAAALLGIACSYPLFGYLMDRLDWPAAFVVCGGATLVAAVAWAVLGAEPPQPVRRRDQSIGWAATFANRSLILLTLSYAAVGYFQYLFFYWAEYYFHEVLDASIAASRGYASLASLAMAGGMFAGGGLSDALLRNFGRRVGRIYLPMAGMAASAALLWLGTLTDDPDRAATWFALSMGALGISEGPFWVAAVDVGRGRGGSSAAFFNTGGNAGGMLAPVVTPWISQHLHWRAGFVLASVVCLIGAALWLGVDVDSSDE